VPRHFSSALKKLDVSVDNVLAVGDTPYDAIAAKRAGISMIGVRCGGFSEIALRQAGCIAIFDGPADLLEQYNISPIHLDI
jgi:phosphoglycolate phosphatase-like HAD superfamily hydrolase